MTRRGRSYCRSASKIRYRTYYAAFLALEELAKVRPDPAYIYSCYSCKGFHVTYKEPWRKGRGTGKHRRGSVRRP